MEEFASQLGMRVQKRILEPLRYEHYLRLADRYSRIHSAMGGVLGFVRRIVRQVKSFATFDRVEGYFRDRNTIAGHCHLVLMKHETA